MAKKKIKKKIIKKEVKVPKEKKDEIEKDAITEENPDVIDKTGSIKVEEK